MQLLVVEYPRAVHYSTSEHTRSCTAGRFSSTTANALLHTISAVAKPEDSSFAIAVHAPLVHLLPLLLLGLAITRHIGVCARNHVGRAQTHGRSPHRAASRKLALERGGTAAGGEEEVDAAPGGRHAGAVDLEASYAEVAREHEERSEEHGHGLEGAPVEGSDEGC